MPKDYQRESDYLNSMDENKIQAAEDIFALKVILDDYLRHLVKKGAIKFTSTEEQTKYSSL